MGATAFILFKKGTSPRIPELLSVAESISKDNNLNYVGDVSEYGDPNVIEYCEIGIGEHPMNFERALLLRLSNENGQKYSYTAFEWDPTREAHFQAVALEGFRENEDLLFTVLYGFLKKYPEAKIYIEWGLERFYALEDMEKIAAKPFNKDWYRINLKDL